MRPPKALPMSSEFFGICRHQTIVVTPSLSAIHTFLTSYNHHIPAAKTSRRWPMTVTGSYMRIKLEDLPGGKCYRVSSISRLMTLQKTTFELYCLCCSRSTLLCFISAGKEDICAYRALSDIRGLTHEGIRPRRPHCQLGYWPSIAIFLEPTNP